MIFFSKSSPDSRHAGSLRYKQLRILDHVNRWTTYIQIYYTFTYYKHDREGFLQGIIYQGTQLWFWKILKWIIYKLINYRRLELINSTDINRSLTSVDRPKLNSFLFRNRVLLLWSSFPSYLPFVCFFLILENKNKNKKQTLIYKRI